jgi:hypothetical protein
MAATQKERDAWFDGLEEYIGTFEQDLPDNDPYGKDWPVLFSIGADGSETPGTSTASSFCQPYQVFSDDPSESVSIRSSSLSARSSDWSIISDAPPGYNAPVPENDPQLRLSRNMYGLAEAAQSVLNLSTYKSSPDSMSSVSSHEHADRETNVDWEGIKDGFWSEALISEAPLEWLMRLGSEAATPSIGLTTTRGKYLRFFRQL